MKTQIQNSSNISRAFFARPIEQCGPSAPEDRKRETSPMSQPEIRKLIEEIMG
ncbi:hypothetical protein [Acidocella aminolytica]|uniref:Uncharacterized protein n=1 Tax=Acidocella aminolytica 101 = DSM 11237 TaxID=1120923 RepID=A0A0D6PDU2_9PROT|nr:hypothetical protein [Acidocella aminolytica]GAN79521.1 hypothetical protein Aam_022_008 [Acidocella aminolytica 101 = DSM 11237]